MQYASDFQEAFRQKDQFNALRQTVITLRSNGVEKDILILELEAFRRRARSRAEEDVVMGVLDLMVGWASPQLRID